jgi:D-glycero-D-manno-heptose 1,7-bisphosphate phosphatase
MRNSDNERPKLAAGSSKGAIFLDRDGVINRLIYHKDMGLVDSPFTISQFQMLPRVADAVRLLNDLQLPVIVVSNQPGIAKKHFSTATLRSFDRKLNDSLRAARAHVDAIYYCVHHPQSLVPALRKRCACRKPGVGMLRRAAKDFDISLRNSFMIGDGLTDIEAGNRAGCRTIFVGRWKCECCGFIRPPGLRPDFVAKDLWEAAQLVQGFLTRAVDTAGISTEAQSCGVYAGHS